MYYYVLYVFLHLSLFFCYNMNLYFGPAALHYIINNILSYLILSYLILSSKCFIPEIVDICRCSSIVPLGRNGWVYALNLLIVNYFVHLSYTSPLKSLPDKSTI